MSPFKNRRVGSSFFSISPSEHLSEAEFPIRDCQSLSGLEYSQTSFSQNEIFPLHGVYNDRRGSPSTLPCKPPRSSSRPSLLNSRVCNERPGRSISESLGTTCTTSNHTRSAYDVTDYCTSPRLARSVNRPGLLCDDWPSLYSESSRYYDKFGSVSSTLGASSRGSYSSTSTLCPGNEGTLQVAQRAVTNCHLPQSPHLPHHPRPLQKYKPLPRTPHTPHQVLEEGILIQTQLEAQAAQLLEHCNSGLEQVETEKVLLLAGENL